MTCLQLTVLFPVKATTWTTLAAFFLSLAAGFGQTGACRPFCAGNYCMTLNQDRIDFKSAEEECHGRHGELMTFQTKTDKNIFDIFTQELHGNFWIGLRLPAGTCSDPSAPLRDYQWTSGSMSSRFLPSSLTWTDGVQVCLPRCVSLSNDGQLTERRCTDRADGYLCKMKHKDACQPQKLSESPVFQSSKGCSPAPCEHICTDVEGGYKCSCFRGYIPASNDPHRCRIFCSQHKCPAVCQSHADSSCFCPDGYLLSDSYAKVCEDIDECSHGWCNHKCENTFGGFVCSCDEGFQLKNKVKCIKAAHNGSVGVATPTASGSVRPTANSTFTGSSAAAGGFIWMWIFLTLAVIVSVVVIRFYVVRNQRNREQNITQQSPEPMDDRALR